MGYIYMIGNKVNNKKYIGQTVRTVEDRWKQHKSSFQYYDNKFQRAIKKYGIENFFIEGVCEVPDSELNKIEIEAIEQYDTYHSGYNSTLGGGGGLKYKTEDLIEAYRRLNSITKVSDEIGIDKGMLRQRLRGAGVELKHRNTGEVHQYAMDGTYIRSYESAHKASKFLGGSKGISAAASGQRRSAGGFQWSFEYLDKMDNIATEPMKCPETKETLYQYTVKGEFVAEYESVADAFKETSVDVYSIDYVLVGKRKSAQGFVWSRNKLSKIHFLIHFGVR